MFSTFVGLGRFISCQRPEYAHPLYSMARFAHKPFMTCAARRMCGAQPPGSLPQESGAVISHRSAS